jgi:Poxvirus A32 protein
VTQQPVQLPIDNWDFVENNNNNKIRKHGSLLPNSFRAVVCGPSNCGKTNAVLSLLLSPNGARFANVYVYAKSLDQPKYTLLEEVINHVKGVKYHKFKYNDDIIDFNDARENSVFLFDDVACDKQDKIREFYAMGRHKSIDPIYMCQTYSKIPKQLIRDNCNMIILFKQDEVNLKHVFEEHVSPDFTFDEFRTICSDCWNSPHGLLVIVKDFDLKNGRYRKGFDKYIN